MPVALPLVEGAPIGASASDYGAGPAAESVSSGGASGPAMSLPSLGMSGFGHADNTSTHVAILVGVALLGLILLHIGGFRFAVDAGVTRI